MRLTVPAILLLTGLPMLAAAQQSNIYRWVDDSGQVHFGDSVPPEYAEQPKQRLDDHAIPREYFSGKKTPEELEQERLEAERQARIEEEKKADQALLFTYQSVDEIELHRDRRLELFKAQRRVTELYLANQRRALDQMHREREQYKPYSADPGAPEVPPDLIRDIRETEELIRKHQGNLQKYRQDEEAIREIFDDSIRRFKKLKGIEDDQTMTASQSETMTASQGAGQTVPE